MHIAPSKKILFGSFLFAFATAVACAQSTDDALRYSRTDFGGTARSMGMAGAFSTVGADFSAASTNPAGLALYRKSEISLSPSLYFSNTESTYLDSTLNDSRSNFNLQHFNFVSARTLRDDQKNTRDWYGSSFSIGYNRLANYNSQQSFAGFNTQNSITDYYAALAEGVPEDKIRDDMPFDAGLAYWVYLINPDATGSHYTATAAGGRVMQTQYQLEKGGMDEGSIAISGNYKDKLYLGASLGIPIIKYTKEKTYSETDASDVIDNFESLSQTDVVKASGVGINGKLGAIYRPTEGLRVGLAVHTPSLLFMNEEFSTYMESFTSTSLSDQSDGTYEYRIKTPWNINTGISYVFGKTGLISLDYAWTDFSQMEFDTDGDDQFRIQINNAIRQKYKPVSTLRIGGELAYHIFRIRAGYSLSGSPYNDATLSDFKRQSITGGVGVRDENIFADVAFVHNTYKDRYTPYPTASDVSLNGSANNVVFTLGFRF
jgi:hypothetical protein